MIQSRNQHYKEMSPQDIERATIDGLAAGYVMELIVRVKADGLTMMVKMEIQNDDDQKFYFDEGYGTFDRIGRMWSNRGRVLFGVDSKTGAVSVMVPMPWIVRVDQQEVSL